MSVGIDRPLSIAEVLDRGFRLFQQAFLRVLPLTLLTSLVSLAPLAVRFTDGDIKTHHYSLAAGITQLTAYVLSVCVLIAVLRLLDDSLRGENRLTLGSSVSSSLRYVFPMFLASIAYGLVVAVGFVLLIVPGIYLMGSMSLFVFCLILDGAGVTESLRRSRELVKGYWWRVSTIVTIAIVIFAAVYAALMAIVGLLMPVLKGIQMVSGEHNSAVVFMSTVSVLVILVSAALNPLYYAIGLVTYRDLQLRKSGADLASRIEQAA